MKHGLTLTAIGSLLFMVGLSSPLHAQPLGESSGLPTESRIFYESFAYSAHVDRTWVVGYPPKTTSIFLNPREAPVSPAAPVVWKHYYQGTFEGFCKSVSGARPCGIPSRSQALAYHYGALGITSHLAEGYPQGKRVIEPVLVPHQPSVRDGGILILGAPTTLRCAEYCDPARRGPAGKTLEK